jgi:hypothetical protein
LKKIPKEKWSQAYDEGRRWGHMTSNFVESMNDIHKGIRNMLVSAMVKATYYRTTTLFALRGHEEGATIGSGAQFAEKCMDMIKEEVIKPTTHIRTKMDEVEKIPTKCGVCRGESRYRKNCPTLNLARD